MITRNNAYIEISINRNVTIAVVVSLLIHMLILFLLSHFDLLNPKRPVMEDQTLDVVLVSPEPPTQKTPTPVEKPPSPPRQERARPIKPLPILPPVRQESVPPPPKPAPTPERTIAPPKPTPPAAENFTDLASYMAAAKERRRLAGDPTAINEAAAENEAKVTKRIPPPTGTNGIFNILSWNSQTIVFDFRGWNNELSFSHRETYQVEADRNTDVQHAMVRKIIEIIRRYYYGDNSDFNWTSQRLGEVVRLSARPQDNAFLENFLMQEFFGSRGIVPR